MKAESRTAILVPPGPNRRWTRSAYAKHTKMAAAIGLTGRTRIGAPRESETDDDGDGPGPRRQWQRQGIEGLVEGIGRPAAVRRSFQFLHDNGAKAREHEQFDMWQSKDWNGQDAAFRFYVTVLGVLIFVSLPDGDLAPPADSPKRRRGDFM
jgi:Predicted small integral membrane protein (DUF2165)